MNAESQILEKCVFYPISGTDLHSCCVAWGFMGIWLASLQVFCGSGKGSWQCFSRRYLWDDGVSELLSGIGPFTPRAKYLTTKWTQSWACSLCRLDIAMAIPCSKSCLQCLWTGSQSAIVEKRVSGLGTWGFQPYTVNKVGISFYVVSQTRAAASSLWK